MTKYHLLLIVSVVTTAISQLLLKKGAMVPHKSNYSIYLNIFTMSGYFFLFCVTILNLFIFNYLTMITIVFFMPITYIAIAIFSSIFFKEKIAKNEVIASILILTGIALYYL